MVDGRPLSFAHGDVAGGLRIGGGFEERSVDDPDEGPVAVLDQAHALGDLPACGTEECAGAVRVSGGEEDRVARVRAGRLDETGLLRLGDVLGHRAGEGAVLGDEDVGEPLGSALLRPVLPRIELAPRQRSAAGVDDRADVVGLEDAERGFGEELREVGEFEAEAQVGLVRTKALHRLVIGDVRDRRLDVVADELPQGDEDLLGEGDDVGLLDERGLDVELSELGLTVGAEVLVAVAAGDLVVALHAGDLEELLEQLRRLRQRVPRPRLQACGDEEVAGALGGRLRQRRRLDLDEAVLVEDRAGGPVDRRAQTHRMRGTRTAQVEVPVAQTGLLADGAGVLRMVGDLEGKGGRLGEDLHARVDDLDLTGGQVGVLVAFGALGDRAGDLDDGLIAQCVGIVLADDDLDDSRSIPQIDEGDTSVIAATIDPPGEGDGLSCVCGTQASGFVASQHRGLLYDGHAGSASTMIVARTDIPARTGGQREDAWTDTNRTRPPPRRRSRSRRRRSACSPRPPDCASCGPWSTRSSMSPPSPRRSVRPCPP
ncbi:Uncharacterised protein [Mycobacteroides abscessus subsp. abscessus]|nr:Uncharacterised protein [Mycobacteroides abscessus subsp. abscessus]